MELNEKSLNICLDGWKAVYAMLEDDESRDIYMNRLNWLISGDNKYIHRILKDYIPDFPSFDEKANSVLQSMPQDKPFVLYGAGADGKIMLPYFAGDKRFLGFCSRTKTKQEQGYCGYPVISPEKLLSRRNLSVVICTSNYEDEIRELLKSAAYPDDLIFTTHGSWEWDREQYFNPSFMKYEDEEVFLDVGCFDLESSLTLKKYCAHVKKVYAFEPDQRNYELCLARKAEENFEEADILPLGAWNEQTTLCFNERGDSGSSIDESGSSFMAVDTIDHVLSAKREYLPSPERVTFIKMDIEGAELGALEGAQMTIQRDKPKLAICIYHKPEDMVTIPLYIKRLVPEYKLYVRHHSNDDRETVLYAIMP